MLSGSWMSIPSGMVGGVEQAGGGGGARDDDDEERRPRSFIASAVSDQVQSDDAAGFKRCWFTDRRFYQGQSLFSVGGVEQ